MSCARKKQTFLRAISETKDIEKMSENSWEHEGFSGRKTILFLRIFIGVWWKLNKMWSNLCGIVWFSELSWANQGDDHVISTHCLTSQWYLRHPSVYLVPVLILTVCCLLVTWKNKCPLDLHAFQVLLIGLRFFLLYLHHQIVYLPPRCNGNLCWIFTIWALISGGQRWFPRQNFLVKRRLFEVYPVTPSCIRIKIIINANEATILIL